MIKMAITPGIFKQSPPNLSQYKIGLVLTNSNILLSWKQSRDHNIRDNMLLIFVDLGDVSGSNVSITSCRF